VEAAAMDALGVYLVVYHPITYMANSGLENILEGHAMI
jgi:hypothetical protein